MDTRQAHYTANTMQLLRPKIVPSCFTPSRRVFYAGVAGLSLCGLFTCCSIHIRNRIRKAKEEDVEKGRRHAEELAFLRRSLSDSHAEIGEMKKSLTVCMEEIERLKKRLAENARDLAGMEKQNQTLADQTRNLSAQNQTLADQTRNLSAQNRKLEAELQKTNAEHRDSTDLLRVRTAELKGAQAFLTKADILSGAEVIKLVDELNGEIMQTAAVMAESFTIEQKIGVKDGDLEEMSKVYGRASEILGYRMAELLKTSEHHEDPILVQMGLQTAMAGYTHWVISSWCFESPEDERMLNEVYARVRETEEQAVSGRWRQLTRTHFQRMVAAPNFANDMVEILANIFIAAGFKESLTALQVQIATCFGERIHIVMQCAQQLNKTIGEGVTSCDLDTLYLEPDIPFDSHTMDDSLNASDPLISEEKVLCTTDLGLGRAEKISGTTGEWQEVTLLKPKVILLSRLFGFIEATPPDGGAL
ncbi:hypothetical protein BYT27DRAFT_7192773 [Phlegmacium glaucopus]|nr:hypothetical protein BYT27DRAFT_7192773 [Phlegmacium glaucopus]